MSETTTGLAGQGLVPIKRFLEVTGMTALQFKKGKGRQFVSTPAGVVFMAAKFDKANPEIFVTVAGANVMAADGVTSLEGSLWLVNAAVTDGDLIGL